MVHDEFCRRNLQYDSALDFMEEIPHRKLDFDELMMRIIIQSGGDIRKMTDFERLEVSRASYVMFCHDARPDKHPVFSMEDKSLNIEDFFNDESINDKEDIQAEPEANNGN